MSRRLLVIFLSVLSSVAIVIFSLLFFMLYTPVGSRWTLFAIEKITANQFNYQKFTGVLAGPFVLKGFAYIDGSTVIRLDAINVDWKPLRLLKGDVVIKYLHINKGKLLLPATVSKTKHKSSFDWFSIVQKADVDVDNIMLSNIRIHNGQQSPVVLKQLRLSMQYNNSELMTDINLSVGHSLINIKGGYQQRWAMSWKVNIPSLADMFADSSGNIHSVGSIVGLLDHPLIDSTLQGLNIRVATDSIGKLYLHTDLTAQGTKKSIVLLRLQHLAGFGLNLDNATLSVNGNMLNQNIQFSLTSLKKSLTMILEGHWKQNYWDGIVKQLHVKTSHLATWSLKSPTKIDANLSKLTLGMLCLISQHNQICGQVNWRKNSSSLAKLEYSLQDFQSVTDLMPSIKNIKGRVTGKILISNFTKKPIFNGYLSYLNGAVVLPDLNVKLFGMNIDGNIKNNKMTVNAMVRSGNGVMQLTGDAGLKDMALYSTINIKGHDFIMSNTKQYRVVVSPDLTVGLQQNTLNVKGNITLHDVLFAPINFSNVVTMPANEVNYIDNIEEPQATPLQINGKVNVLLDKKVKVNFKGVTGGLTGGLLLTMKPQQPIIASGQLSLINGKYSIYGQNLDIHNSQIIYHNMPIDNPNLDITAVRVIKQDQLDTLTYSNNDLTVGVTISGSVAQPKYVFFSIPAGLSQSDILSYLVLGQAFNQANSSTGQLLVSLTQALQSGNGPGVFGKVTNDIKRSFGLSELSLQTSNSQGDNGDKPFTTSSLVVGKYLLPRLYVSYGFGFLGAVNTVRMRYSLKHNWALQTESNSIGSGADILYSIER